MEVDNCWTTYYIVGRQCSYDILHCSSVLRVINWEAANLPFTSWHGHGSLNLRNLEERRIANDVNLGNEERYSQE